MAVPEWDLAIEFSSSDEHNTTKYIPDAWWLAAISGHCVEGFLGALRAYSIL